MSRPNIYCVKTVTRHVWKDYEDLADDARYTPKYRDLYKQRKETIERVFADAKEKHAMRYTQYRGLAQVTNWVKLKFAAMNLKKLARWKWKERHLCWRSRFFPSICARNPAAHEVAAGFLDRLNRPKWAVFLERKSYIDRIFSYGCKCEAAVANGHPWLQIEGYGCRAFVLNVAGSNRYFFT